MVDLEHLGRLAHDGVDPAWDVREAERALRGMLRKRRVRRVRSAVMTAAGIMGLAWAGFAVGRNGTPAGQEIAGTVEVAPAPAAGGVIHLRDGSVIRAMSGDTELRVVEDGARLSKIGLLRGGARFEVEAQRGRAFLVTAGDVTVEVVGTVFSVQHLAGTIEVKVEQGAVKVTGVGGAWTLQPGDVRRLPAGQEQSVEGDASSPTPKRVVRSIRPERKETWRAYVHEGRYDEAFAALGDASPSSLARSATLLLEAADAARYSGHPREAVAYLQEVLRVYGHEPLAALAAFTLGRLQLEQLGDAVAAARSFAQAYAVSANESLAQDALAREVEAWSKAGDRLSAAERARQYLQRFPQGPRAETVRLLGGVV
jgi:transmembrane sensor